MKKSNFKILLLSVIYLLTSCNYEAGNRGVELNYDMRISLNSFYVEKFLKQNYSVTDSIDAPLNSELKNYPERFFILRDTVNNLYYVVETSITNDSLNIQEWGVALSSIYNNSRSEWIYSRDSITPEMLK